MENNSMMGRKRKTLSQLNLPNATSSGTKKKRSNERSAQKRAGTITQVVLKNFMCHSMLVVDLSTNINVVIGRNGSGKSAILTALIVGLGGRTSLTNRGTAVKGFIKAGKQSGCVEICLYNEGFMAYKPKVYGSRITIIRSFNVSGASTYRIKSESGKTISTQVREIQNITTSLNIQVDNPVCILNQDVSRNFLSSSDPKHKFALFVKATKLEALAEQYKTAAANLEQSLRLFDEKQASFKKLKSEMKELDRKIENQQSIISIGDKIKTMQVELVWAHVRDAEGDVQKVQDKVESIQDNRDKLMNECASRSDRIDNIKTTITKLRREMGELSETIQVQTRPQFEVKRAIDELTNKYREKRQEKQLLASTIESKTRDAEVLQTEMENVNKNMTKVEQEKIERLRKLNEMNEKMKGMEDHLQTCQNDLYQIRSDTDRKEEEKQRIRLEIAQLEQRIGNERGSLSALKSESGNSLLLYGRDIPKVKQLIEQNRHNFAESPRGPLGSYIRLKNKKWAVAVESYLTPSLLGSFTCDNKNDNALLVKIFNQVWSGGRKPTIITSKFFHRKHDVRPNLVQAPQDCVSMYDALEIDDAVVANCIVDQSGVEGVLLIPSNDRAMQLLSNQANVPRNCKQGVTTGGDRYYPDPNYKTYGSRYHRAQYLQVDTKEHIAQLENNLKDLAEKKSNVEKEFAAIARCIREQETKKAQLEEKIQKMNAARVQIRRKLEEWKATAEPEVASVELLESELVEIRRILQEKTARLSAVEDAIKEVEQSIREKDEKLKSLKQANYSLEERMRVLEAQIQEDTTRQKEISTSDEFDKRKLKEFTTRLKEATAELEVKRANVQKLLEQSGNLGERLQTKRNVPDIMAEIKQLQRSVKRIESETEDNDQLMEKYQHLLEKCNKLSALLSCLNDDIKELNTAVDKRSRHYKLTENYFVAYIKHSFKKIMELRQFEGSIEIDMSKKLLELIVIPQQGSQGVTTTSNLSGGERSFSTVAFLYALWQCMEFPFYFLDEFDVYMDKLNRTKAIDILLHHAETHPELQFVFLTPQDVSFINKTNVSILRLSDPERSAV